VYLQPGYSKNAQPYDLLVVFDGQTSIDIVPTPTTLDNLISEKRIAPTVALIVGNVNGMRGTELPCNPTFAEFLNSELIPWLRRNYNVTRDPQQVTIGGYSYGGLAATCAAYRHPETFGNVARNPAPIGGLRHPILRSRIRSRRTIRTMWLGCSSTARSCPFASIWTQVRGNLTGM
jgi:enterochelin esterase-like enzyme